MVIVTEEIDLPTAQPKSFHLPIVSPSNDVPIPHTKAKSPKSISLSLRRVTPDRFKSSNSNVVSPTSSRGGNNNNIERQQKMQDEFYDGPQTIEEDLDDGELPSLSRTPSTQRSVSRSPAPVRTVTAFWSQQDEEFTATLAAKTAADKSAADMARRRMASNSHQNNVIMDDREFERVRVAGFWSQLDEVSEEGSFEKGPRLKTVHYNGEEEPEDERQWRRSQSPAAAGRTKSSAAGGGADNLIGLDLHSTISGETDESDKDTNTKHTRETKSTNQHTAAAASNWNLVEKAACFANETNHDIDQNRGGEDDSKSDQSLDRTYQTASQTAATADYTRESSVTGSRGNITIKEEEEQGMFHCLTDALGAICGYSTYVGDDNAATTTESHAEKKKRALAIIESDRQRRQEDEEGEYSEDEEETDAHSKGVGIKSFDSEYEEEEDEEAAIELEYLSIDNKEEAARQMATRDRMASNTVVAGVAAVGAAGLVAATATANSACEEPETTPEPAAPANKSEAKKKRLTVKAVKNLLGLRKKKEVVNEETPNLAAVMTSSAKASSELEPTASVPSSPVQNVDDDMPEMEDVDDDSIFTDGEDEEEPEENPTQEESTLGGLNSYHNQDETTARGDLGSYQHNKGSYKNRSIFDEEELESQAAGWDSNRKNAYLRELSQRAKQEYRTKKSVESHPDPDLTAGVTASMGAAALGAAAIRVGAAAMMNADDNDRPASPEVQEDNVSATESKNSYNVDYNSLNALEKRKFLRLLNSGMSPQDATRIIVDEREKAMPVLEDVQDDDHDDEMEGDADEEGYDYEPQEKEDGERSVHSYDPPGSVLEGESGESAEPSIQEAEETVRDVSRSEKATAGGTSHDARIVAAGVAGTAVVAAMAVPAIVRAKSKSKSPGQQLYDDDEQQQEQVYQRGADGLVSVGDKYYDSLQTSYEQEDVDNTLLLDRDNGKKSKRISMKPSVSSFAKATSRRSIVSPRSSSNKFTSVNEKSVAQQHFSRPNGSRTIPQDEPSDDIVGSPISEASVSRAPKKFNFIHRGSKWSKLGSNLDSDAVATQQVEEEQREFYSPRSAPTQDVRSPISIPTPGSAHAYGKSPVSSVRPSPTEASLALPSLLLAADDRERNVVTPTNEIDKNEEVFSPAASAVETASRANSLFMSPDTLSPTSPQDFGSIAETPASQIDEGSRGIDGASQFSPMESEDAQSAANSHLSRSINADTMKASTPRSASSSPANQMPIIPTSPTEYVSPNHTDGHSITNSSLAGQSFVTLGTTCTKSSRRRHKGAAGKRLMEAKEADSHAGARSKGWMGSIRDVAAKREQVWDPEKGWQDYEEPEPISNFGQTKPIGNLQLNEKITHRKREPAVEFKSQETSHTANAAVAFPGEWASERKNMIDLMLPRDLAMGISSVNDVALEEKSAFTSDASTVSTSADTAGLLSNAVPVRRTKPKQRSAGGTRKATVTAAPTRAVGWKESMEAVTSQMTDENRQWNYEEGWIENKDYSDDVRELTRMTLERSPESVTGSKQVGSSASPISPAYFLPSVVEGTAESSSQAEEDALAEGAAARGSSAGSFDSENECDLEEFDVDAMLENNAPAEDSDKENELSQNLSEIDYENESPKLATEEFPLSTKQTETKNLRSVDNKPPLPKKTLNQWLERSLKDSGDSGVDVESENAVDSARETVGDSLDDVQVDEDEERRSEINVVRERCTDNDNNLFQNDVSDIQLDSSNSREIVIESFESANSSENEWLNTLSPKEKGDDEKDNNVSSRAMAWMSSMEKKSSTYKPAHSQSKAATSKSDPPRTKVDPPQNLDPPSLVSDRVTTKRIASRYSSGTLSSSNATTPTSNQNNAPKSKVEELISKIENPGQQVKVPRSDHDAEEHDVIFHSSAMGIRLKRGEDGLVRVVSVTESSPGSSIVRDGRIEPDDILREAAGADLRKPITNSQWGEVVQVIRNASRPMKFVILSANKEKEPPAPIPQEKQSQPARTVDQSPALQKPPQILFGADSSVGSSYDDESTAKQSILNLLAQCAVPEKAEKSINREGNEVPMAHLAFLRTNPTIARVRNEASRRYPALCGRPDTIFEEPEDAEADQRQQSQRPSSMDRSFDTSADGSYAPTSITGLARTGISVGSTSVADNVAYLDRLTSKSPVSNKPTRTWNNTKVNQGRRSPTGEVGWPESDGKARVQEFNAVSSYSSKSQSSYHRQAELPAETKVVAMMEHELQHLDSSEECEI